MVTVRTEKELAKVIERKEPTIEVVADLKNNVFKIKMTGDDTWKIAAFAIAAGVVAFIFTGPGALVPASAAVTVLGGGATLTALSIAAVGGVALLNEMRDSYEILEENKDHIILKRK